MLETPTCEPSVQEDRRRKERELRDTNGEIKIDNSIKRSFNTTLKEAITNPSAWKCSSQRTAMTCPGCHSYRPFSACQDGGGPVAQDDRGWPCNT